MKGLKKVALASAIAAVSAGAQAELKALDDAAMGELTGQAGITIDIETKWTIGEFVYQDAGMLVIQGMSFGANSNDLRANADGLMTNERLSIDLAGDGTGPGQENTFNYGMSEVIGLAAFHSVARATAGAPADADFDAAAARLLSGGATASTDGVGGDQIDDQKTYGNGDLVLHFGFSDAWDKGGGFAAFGAGLGQNYDGTVTGLNFATLDYATARDIASRAVDFQFDIDLIGIADSNYTIGSASVEKTNHTTGTDATSSTTALISDLSMKGYLGPVDILIENNGNGFGADGSGLGGAAGTGNADSKINWDSFFRITDLDLYIDIAGVQLSDIAIHNDRGDTTSLNGTASFGYAHSMRQIFAVKDTVLSVGNTSQPNTNPDHFVDGIAINTRFKGDIDIGALSFGDTGTSIGSIYMTDVEATTNWTISAR